jgi:hypothetical protein
MKSRFKTLASELIAHGVQSQYMARIEARIAMEQRLEGLHVEHQQEMACALGKTELRVLGALAELELRRARNDRALRSEAPREECARLVDAFNEQRLVAHARVRDLLIHREAIGFRQHHVLDELYPVAPKLSLPAAGMHAQAHACELAA